MQDATRPSHLQGEKGSSQSEATQEADSDAPNTGSPHLTEDEEDSEDTADVTNDSAPSNTPLTPSRASSAAGSEVESLAAEEVSQPADGSGDVSGDVSGDDSGDDSAPPAGTTAADKSEQQTFEVPPGKFWLHDDRFSEDTANRQAGAFAALSPTILHHRPLINAQGECR